jgi:rod shape determining protein RodA
MATITGPGSLQGEAPREGSRLREIAAGLDWTLLLAVGALLAFSLYVVDVATAEDVPGDPDFFVVRRMVHIGIGVLALVAMYLINPDRIARWAWVLLGVLLGALTVVFLIGTVARGSTRWITIGPLNVQPSEAGKVILILALAAIISERANLVGTVRLSVLALLVTAAPAVIIFIEPDLGTAMVYFAILAGILLIAGVPWHHFAVAGGVGVVGALVVLAALPAAGAPVLEDYQVDRLTAFVDSERDTSASGYQLDQSKTAIGSGGALGKGPDGATQTINDFLPEHHNDFIFAVVAEMFGFVGGAGLVLLFGLILWRAMRIAENASSRYDQLIVAGIISMLIFQVFVNIGMTVGIMPITGIPLPFMSFGGSHTIATMAAVGILLRIHARGGSGQA